eukprot:Gregarina_sp_Pseudo_9__2093@NODE_2457_length_989_cov_14_615789_g2260_i0_p1_GENE_NODE_2457_length_989_cov_14_615789_g2260_i0NODE_2457_length_989_cov_14_615789_g2260_i0_p1_ORF_typecomplete_len173_score33_28PITH/PF06201_13/3_6e30_NODE_2457_length_989_cov_14_615789_g2260_i0406924
MSAKFSNLDSLIDKTSVECLNEDPKFPVTGCLFQPNVDLETRSLDDPELLIKFGFTCPVKIGQFSVKVSKAVAEAGSYPDKLHLFVNQPDLDFSNRSDHSAKECVTLGKQDVIEGKKIELRLAKFQNIRHLAIFVESNPAEAEVTRLGSLTFFGLPESTLDMKAWKPTEERE